MKVLLFLLVLFYQTNALATSSLDGVCYTKGPHIIKVEEFSLNKVVLKIGNMKTKQFDWDELTDRKEILYFQKALLMQGFTRLSYCPSGF